VTQHHAAARDTGATALVGLANISPFSTISNSSAGSTPGPKEASLQNFSDPLWKNVLDIVNTDNWHFNKWQNFGIKHIARKRWQMFWKTVIFGSICKILHHLATLLSAPLVVFTE